MARRVRKKRQNNNNIWEPFQADRSAPVNMLDLPSVTDYLPEERTRATLREYDPGVVETISRAVGLMGGDTRRSQQIGRRVGGLADWTPAGDVDSIEMGANMISQARPGQSVTQDFSWSDAKDMGLGAGIMGLGALGILAPGPSAKNVVKPQGQMPRGMFDRVDDALADMQSAFLDEKTASRLAGYASEVPGFGEAMKWMTPEELVAVKSAQGAQRVVDAWNAIPSRATLQAMAKMGNVKKGWYENSAKSIAAGFGDDAPRFTALLAALSPQTSVESNMVNAAKVWRGWNNAGRPTDRKSILRIMGENVQGNKGEESVLGAWKNNSVLALSAKDPLKALSGGKVHSFWLNTTGNPYPVTNDAWMANAFGIDQAGFAKKGKDAPGFGPIYGGVAAKVRAAGDGIGMLPAEVQETIWSYAKATYEGAQTAGVSPAAFIASGGLTDDAVRGVADFSTLFNEMPEARQLADIGVRIDDMPPIQWADPIDLSPAEREALRDSTSILDNLSARRKNDSAFKTYFSSPVKVNDREGVMMIPYEQMPGEGTGVGVGSGKTGEDFEETFRLFNIDADPSDIVPLKKGQQAALRSGTLSKDIRGQNALVEGIWGPRSASTTYGTGSWLDPTSGEYVQNPLATIGGTFTYNVDKSVPKNLLDRANAGATALGAIHGQHGVPIAIPRRVPKGDSFSLVTGSAATPESMKKIGGLLGEDGYATDVGNAVIISPGVNSAEDIAKRAHATLRYGPREAISQEGNRLDLNSGGYIELPWGAGYGSGAVADEVISAFDILPKAAQKRMDPGVREIAQAVLNRRNARMKMNPSRGDYMNMLEGMAQGGVDRLRQLRAEGVALPAIGGVGLMGLMDEEEATSPEEPLASGGGLLLRY